MIRNNNAQVSIFMIADSFKQENVKLHITPPWDKNDEFWIKFFLKDSQMDIYSSFIFYEKSNYKEKCRRV